MTRSAPSQGRFASGLSSLIGPYAALVCDIWGVVHDGLHVFPEAAECLARTRAGGRPVLLLSNSPRPSDGVLAQLDALGLDRGAYDGVVTSGDATRAAIASGRFGRHFYFLGPDRDRPLLDGVPLEEVALDSADFLLVTGLLDDETETPRDYAPLLGQALERGLPLICANPDIVVHRGDTRLWCAGALAGLYAEMGGTAHLFGKPHSPIYELCRERLSALLGRPVPSREVLAVGDGIETDILGSERAGMDAVLIASGIHRDALLDADKRLLPDALNEACARAGAHPIAVLPVLRW